MPRPMSVTEKHWKCLKLKKADTRRRVILGVCSCFGKVLCCDSKTTHQANK